MNTITKKQQIIAALYAFVGQRGGLEFGNYGDVRSYRAEQRQITKDGHQARRLIRDIELRDSITADDIIKASKHAYSGRLTIVERNKFECMTCTHKWNGAAHVADVADVCPKCKASAAYYRPAGFAIDYCAGQYFPTEYRRAVCAVCASVLWDWKRTQCMPEPEYIVDGRKFPDIQAAKIYAEALMPVIAGIEEKYNGKSGGQYLRDNFKREYGRAIASRWFD